MKAIPETLLTIAIFVLGMNIGKVNANGTGETLSNNEVWTLEELKVRGERVYAANCASCHQTNGRGIPGAFPPLDGSSIVNGPKPDEIHVLLNGRTTSTQVTMPPWKDVLSDTDIAAVITYVRNSWGNQVKDNVVQPAEVLAARN